MNETRLTKKRMFFSVLFTILLIALPASNVLAVPTHSIHIEWDYEPHTAPVDADLSSYRLYKDGIRVCQMNYPYDFEGDCVFQSNDGIFNFTLTAVFDDGTESPRSAPFPFRLGAEKVNVGVILAVIGLLSKD